MLAGLSLRDEDDIDDFVDSFHGDDQLVADYLTDELLDSVDPDERRRLLEVSILDRLSGPLIDEVCGVDDGAEWLADLASSNQLVIALDRTGTWYPLPPPPPGSVARRARTVVAGALRRAPRRRPADGTPKQGS